MPKLTKKQFESLQVKLSDLLVCYDFVPAEDREILRSALRIADSIEKQADKERAEEKAKKADPRYPNAGIPWQDEEYTLVHDLIDAIPDEEIESHVTWLAKKLGRTPNAIALKIVSLGRCNAEWAEPFRNKHIEE